MLNVFRVMGRVSLGQHKTGNSGSESYINLGVSPASYTKEKLYETGKTIRMRSASERYQLKKGILQGTKISSYPIHEYIEMVLEIQAEK